MCIDLIEFKLDLVLMEDIDYVDILLIYRVQKQKCLVKKGSTIIRIDYNVSISFRNIYIKSLTVSYKWKTREKILT